MFELGTSLRQTREAEGLELCDAERLTRIRVRHLAALEGERFADLPAGYERTFLRSYAEFLGLDGNRYVDEYLRRFPPEEPVLPRSPVRRRRAPPLGALVAFAVFATLAGLLAAGHFGSRKKEAPPLTIATPKPRKSVSPKPIFVRSAPARPRRARIVVRAAGGAVWLSARVGSAQGRVLYERTLAPAETLVFVQRRLWLRLGAPRNVELVANGKRVGGLSSGSPLNLVVDAGGARSAPPGYTPPAHRT